MAASLETPIPGRLIRLKPAPDDSEATHTRSLEETIFEDVRAGDEIHSPTMKKALVVADGAEEEAAEAIEEAHGPYNQFRLKRTVDQR